MCILLGQTPSPPLEEGLGACFSCLQNDTLSLPSLLSPCLPHMPQLGPRRWLCQAVDWFCNPLIWCNATVIGIPKTCMCTPLLLRASPLRGLEVGKGPHPVTPLPRSPSATLSLREYPGFDGRRKSSPSSKVNGWVQAGKRPGVPGAS